MKYLGLKLCLIAFTCGMASKVAFGPKSNHSESGVKTMHHSKSSEKHFDQKLQDDTSNTRKNIY